MAKRAFRVTKSGIATPCPKCGNDRDFVARSRQVSEDCCECWVECKCGYDPTADDTNKRVEDVWGDVSRDVIPGLLRSAWDQVLSKQERDGATTEPALHRVTMMLCSLCLDGTGGECHTPGCSLWINRAPDLSLRNCPSVEINSDSTQKTEEAIAAAAIAAVDDWERGLAARENAHSLAVSNIQRLERVVREIQARTA